MTRRIATATDIDIDAPAAVVWRVPVNSRPIPNGSLVPAFSGLLAETSFANLNGALKQGCKAPLHQSS